MGWLKKIGILSIFLISFCFVVVYADTSWTTERQVTPLTEDTITLPILTEGSNDSLNLLWWDFDAQHVPTIFYSKLNKYGRTLIAPKPLFQPHTTSIGLTSATDSENNIHLVWVELNNSLSRDQLFYTKISDDGMVLINPKPITAPNPELSSGYPYLSYKNNNLYLAYGQGNMSGDWQTRPTTLYFAKFNTTGDRIISDRQITDSSLISVEPRLFVDSGNDVNIVYTRRENNYGNNADARFSKLDNDGNILVSDKLLFSSTWIINLIGDKSDGLNLLMWNENGNYAKTDNYGNTLIQPKNVINNGYFSWGSASLDSENNINLVVLLKRNNIDSFPNVTYIKMNRTGDFLEYRNITAVDDSASAFLLVKQNDDSKHIIYNRKIWELRGSTWYSYNGIYYRNTLPPEQPERYSPLNKIYANSSNITFYWSAPFSSVSYKLQYSTNTTFPDVYTTTVDNISTTHYQQQAPMPDGIYYWRVSANNTAGESNYSNYSSFIVDTKPPQISIILPQNKTYDSASIDLDYTATDTISGVSSVWYQYNGINTTLSANISFMALDNQQSNLILYADDLAGNINSKSVTFTIDTINPQISFTTGTEADNSHINRNWIYANVSIAETNFKNLTFYLYNSTLIGSITDTNLTKSINWTNLADGTYYINATTYDAAGNYNATETRQIVLDTTSPAWSNNITGNSSGVYLFNITWNDTYMNTVVIEHNFSGTLANYSVSNISNVYYYNYSTDGGMYQYRYYANDSAGNSNSSDLWIVALPDIVAPVITIIAPINGSALPAGTTSATINLLTNENATCRYSTNSSFLYENGTNFTTTGNTSHSFAYPVSSGNTYSIYYLCNDTSGNVNFQAKYHTFSVSSAETVTPIITSSGGGGGGGGSGSISAPNTTNKTKQVVNSTVPKKIETTPIMPTNDTTVMKTLSENNPPAQSPDLSASDKTPTGLATSNTTSKSAIYVIIAIVILIAVVWRWNIGRRK